ncbi:hypothetical protein AAFF_G00007900 [Aldrovandia affinis]|uniref:Uncharacterized protein n=1 Tax=Aldrovandia affinis TaxID=143900 RepID=A0AAD7WZM5_9TELE|nr:hypothetical protein AAFF_G00007900 [Aldrovandia affinis]
MADSEVEAKEFAVKSAVFPLIRAELSAATDQLLVDCSDGVIRCVGCECDGRAREWMRQHGRVRLGLFGVREGLSHVSRSVDSVIGSLALEGSKQGPHEVGRMGDETMIKVHHPQELLESLGCAGLWEI